jgi:hypothetical protein
MGGDDDARHERHDDDVEGAAGECIPCSTSLVDGEACTVRVLFSPSQREVLTGSLTISSPLARATELPLAGRGIQSPGARMNLGRRDTDDVARVELGVATVQLRAPRLVSIGLRALDVREEPRRERQAVSLRCNL